MTIKMTTITIVPKTIIMDDNNDDDDEYEETIFSLYSPTQSL